LFKVYTADSKVREAVMRVISCVEFWNKVRQVVGEDRFCEISEIFMASTPKNETTTSELSKLYDAVIPLFVEGAEINGCRRSESERECQQLTREALMDAALEHPVLLSPIESVKQTTAYRHALQDLHLRYVEISERFKMQRKCHSHLTDGYTCFCDKTRLN
jgi:hypothetical protein